MLRWFESLIDVFAPLDGRRPPPAVVPFYLHYLRPVWPVLLDSLDALMAGKTVIVIRLSTIARMDRLVVMDQGRIVESGTHAALIAAGGLYARLWARQTGGFVQTGGG